MSRRWLLTLLILPLLALAGCGSSSASSVKAKINQPSERIGGTVPVQANCSLGASDPEAGTACVPEGARQEAPKITLTGSQIHLSHRGAVLIESFEGFGSCPYFDSFGGVWTRGFGETEGISAHSACISRTFGERNLISRAERFYGFAIKRLHTSFNQNEIDAQFSFLWNLGAGIDPPGSSLAIGFQHHSCNGILGYVHAGGVTLAGLITRRRAECQRFHEPAHEETPAQHRARVKKERTAKLHADYHKRRALRSVISRYRCSHGYRGFSHDHKRKCTAWRKHGARVNHDIAYLRKHGIR